MKFIQLTSQNETDWCKQFIDDSHYDKCLNENAFVRKPNGEPLLVLLKNVISPVAMATAWGVLKRYNVKTGNRAIATGIDAQPRKKQDGTLSSTTIVPKGWEVASGIVGYYERTVRMPYAHACSWNQNNPDKFARLFPLCQEVSALFKEHVPERWQFQKDIVDKTPAEYIIPGTVFTTLTINKNYRTSAHRDAGDLPGGFSCLSVLREGRYLGGRLVFPNYRVAANVDNGDLILFDPHEIHGNTQIVPVTPEYQRCSIVYYFREMLQHCLPPSEELKRAKNRKTGDALYD